MASHPHLARSASVAYAYPKRHHPRQRLLPLSQNADSQRQPPQDKENRGYLLLLLQTSRLLRRLGEEGTQLLHPARIRLLQLLYAPALSLLLPFLVFLFAPLLLALGERFFVLGVLPLARYVIRYRAECGGRGAEGGQCGEVRRQGCEVWDEWMGRGRSSEEGLEWSVQVRGEVCACQIGEGCAEAKERGD